MTAVLNEVAPAIPAPRMPGVFYDMPEEVYHSGIELSKSQIGQFLKAKTPAHYRYEIKEWTQDKQDNLDFGSLVDCMIFEPHLILSRFRKGPEVKTRADKRWKESKAAAEEDGVTLIRPKDWDDATAMARTLREHEKLAPLMLEDTDYQVSLFWDDQTIGWPLRARLDTYNRAINIAIDLKTADDASLETFSKRSFDLGYHIQSAMYQDGWVACGNDPFDMFMFVVIDKTRLNRRQAFEVACFEMDAEAVEIGRKQYKQAGAEMAQYLMSGHWPGFPQHLQAISAPYYVRKEYDQAT